MSPEAKALFARHVMNIVSRTNRYTGVMYADNPTIMSWQICNEPCVFSTEVKDAFAKWIADVAALIGSLAPRRPISTGTRANTAAGRTSACSRVCTPRPNRLPFWQRGDDYTGD